MKAISSRQNPLVRAFADLARTPDPTGARVLLDGVHLVRDAVAAGVELEAVALASSRTPATAEADVARAIARQGGRVTTVSPRAFAAMSPVRAPSGIVAIARRRPVAPDAVCRRQDAFIVVAADVQDPGNLGSLIRAAEAAAVDGVLVCGTSANPFSGKAARGRRGSILRLPVAAGLGIDAAIGCVRRHGARVIAAVPRAGRDPDTVSWRGAVALLVGGEGAGLSADAIDQADERVTIPMAAPVESVNVAVAAAILVYAARRQRI
ncbi:MAG: RNA methyltransferase [Acidobacteria bacterium]|nr:RNA methyltransferase [Acidobacteriota bacterium]